ncbi:LamG-like jellyroll fold domain-containing protein [Haloferula sp. BvORR071]|uniref:LamG-like jellyroll fold domain-containing protein n=1 Tax=Haloferula sp. BvORR071 TaxID=1396141 RepID=UPI00055892E0|nr:LamG-like jellyroll fold domain-containing protein [Haloferula sp. BvORR071]
MKSNTHRLLPVATLALLGSQWQATASIAPYAADANTTYLYHLDEPADTTAPFSDPAVNSSTLSTSGQKAIPFDGNPYAGDGIAQPAPGVSQLGAAGLTGFGNSANITAADFGLGVDLNGNNAFDMGDAAPASADQAADHGNIFGVGNRFTLEAMVKVPSITSGIRHIISTDDNGATADRGLIFRITAGGLLEFNAVGSSATFTVPIPTTGPHAWNAANWYHVAAVYDGSNVLLYWTKADPLYATANLIGTAARSVDFNDDALLVIGNEGRGTSGEGLLGQIDEVRISNVARTPSQFIFRFVDTDSDGMDDGWETAYFGNLAQTAAGDADSDGRTNIQEYTDGTIPNNADSDGDGLTDGEELSGSKNLFAPGTPTNPLLADSDGDKLSDKEENGSLNTAFGSAPSNPNDADTDDDTISDYEEVVYKANPNSAASVPAPSLFYLINNTRRNGSFELLGAAPGTANAAKAANWDTAAAGDVTYWTIWPVSTANGDSGTETSGTATNGTKRGYMQAGNAVYNLTDVVAQEGDVYAATWRHVATAGTLSVNLVYDSDTSAGVSIVPIDASLATTTAAGGVGHLVFRIPAGSPAIGKQIGIGLRSAASWIGLDEVALNIADRDSDGDGLGDFWEDQYFGNNDAIPTPAELALQSGTSDFDGDGLSNAAELALGTSPSDTDSDDDGLSDGEEDSGSKNAAFFNQRTSPTDADSDDDGVSDGNEVNGTLNVAFGHAPTDPNQADTDFDSWSDALEFAYGTNPNSDTSVPALHELIGLSKRNGGFETINGGVINTAKIATGWDAAGNDVDEWKNWTEQGGTYTDTGVEGGGTAGMKAYVQNGSALYNLPPYAAKASNVLRLTYNRMGGNTLAAYFIYESGGAILQIPTSTIQSSTDGLNKQMVFTIPAGSPAIGQRIGVGFKNSQGQWASLDNVVLTVIDADSDGDGLSDFWEDQFFGNNDENPTPAELALQNGSGDADGDGFSNEQEESGGSSPILAASIPGDVDGDGLADAWEIGNFGSLTAQNGSGDPDRDYSTNEQEETAGTSPIDSTQWPDSDGDGLADGWEMAKFGNLTQTATGNPDGDSGDNLAEMIAGSNPASSAWTPTRAQLTHRWSFNGNLNDSVGGSNATIVDVGANDATLGSNEVTMTGGDRASSDYVDLGTNLLQGKMTPVTIELWATQNQVQQFGRIFDFNNDTTNEYLFMAFSAGTNVDSNRVGIKDTTETTLDLPGAYDLGTKYHIVMTLTPAFNEGATNGTQVRWYSAPAGNANPLGVQKGTFLTPHHLVTLNDVHNWLGRSIWPGDGTASASFDEVRIWDGKLTEVERELFQVSGPDVISFADSDGDGLFDAWEISYFGNLAQTAAGDPDHDGISNVDEQTAFLNPTSAGGGIVDTDSDGLDDAWETTYFGSLTETAAGDFDKDGTDNLTEFLLGLVPNDGKSAFQATRAANGTITWPSVAGTTFKIERSQTMAAGSWTVLQAAYAGQAGTTSYSDPAPLANKGFYRVTLNP